MIIVIIVSTIAMCLTIFSSYSPLKQGLKIAFLLVTILACIHYQYGNDYNSYYSAWQVISNNSLKVCLFGSKSIFDDGVRPETGWIIINKLFSFKNGFYYLVAALNILINGVYYFIITHNVPRRYWWLAFFIYIFSYQYYLLNFSMMRQGLAICLGILSVYCFGKNKYAWFVGLSVWNVLLHTSAVILIPIVFISKLASKHIKVYSEVLLTLTILLYIVSAFATRIFSSIIQIDMFSKYNDFYVGQTASGFYGIGFCLIAVQYALMLFFLLSHSDCKNAIGGSMNTYKIKEEYSGNNTVIYRLFDTGKLSESDTLYILVSYTAFMLKPFESVGAELVVRLSFYFTVFDIITLPIIYSKMKNQVVRIIFIVMLVVLLLYTYFSFWNKPVYHEYYSVFHTIFEL